MNTIVRYVCFLFVVSVMAQAVPQDTLMEEHALTTKSTTKLVIDKSVVATRHFEDRFKERYTSKSFQYDIKDDPITGWERFKLWLSDVFYNLFKINKNYGLQSAIELFFRILAALVVMVVAYRIIKMVLNKEGQWIFTKSMKKKTMSYEGVEKDIQTLDFKKEIDQALHLGETRLCIRYYYLWLLKILAEKELILWDSEKTNSDYLMEIRDNVLKQEFEYLSYLYDYVWYGKFELDELTFDCVRRAFEKTLKAWDRE